MMLIQQQPNRHSCVLTAFAMALDIDQNLLIKDLGHDGSEIIFPDLPEPLCRRGFDPREFVYWAAERNIAIVQLDSRLERGNYNSNYYGIRKYNEMLELMYYKIGVITGTIGNSYHTLAWDGFQALGSEGRIYHNTCIGIDCFYWVNK